jgi:branched-chain amino acid aminotransferase
VPWVRNERAATAGLKTTSYADNVIALARAKQQGAAEAILANTRGELCEATGSNVFVVVDGVVRTPPLDSGCLAGITRELLLEWCAADGVEVVEQPLPLEVLAAAHELFITSSIKDVFPVSSVDGRALPAPGPVTARVQQVWAAHATLGVDP